MITNSEPTFNTSGRNTRCLLVVDSDANDLMYVASDQDRPLKFARDL